MAHRHLGSVGSLAVVIVLLTSGLTMGQTRAPASADDWIPPQTPWGEPDLQGVWRHVSTIPFERPADLAGRELLTAEEVDQQEQEERSELDARLAGADFQEIGRRDSAESPIAGNEYNQFWFETGQSRTVSARTSMIVDPPDGRMPRLSRELQEKQAYWRQVVSSYPPADFRNNSWSDRDTGERCLTDGLPAQMWSGTGPNQIVQGPGYVAILHEQFRDRRIIPTDGRPQGNIRRWLGVSRGRWEGSTLVVETGHFVDRSEYQWSRVWRSPSETMRLVERFTRVADDELEYEMTLTDPAKFARPWTVRIPITKLDQLFFEYACHEGNYGMIHLLSQARNLEKAAGTDAEQR